MTISIFSKSFFVMSISKNFWDNYAQKRTLSNQLKILRMNTTIKTRTSAKNLLVINHMDFAEKLANHLNLCGFPQDELYSEAYLGLCEAASKFNPTLGVSFRTYAYEYIRKYVLLYINKWILHSSKCISIDSFYDEKDETHECQLQVADPYDMEQHACARSNRKELLRTLCAILTAREYDVICSLFHLNGVEEDERTIALRLGVSRQAINLSKQSALKKIRATPCISQLLYV